jgi:hypothetical protein
MEEIILKSQEELYKRIRPALRSKCRMLKQLGYTYVLEEDIWDYLRLNKWLQSYGLELCDMVDDILHADDQKIIAYCHNKYMNEIEKKNKIEDDNIDLPKLKS